MAINTVKVLWSLLNAQRADQWYLSALQSESRRSDKNVARTFSQVVRSDHVKEGCFRNLDIQSAFMNLATKETGYIFAWDTLPCWFLYVRVIGSLMVHVQCTYCGNISGFRDEWIYRCPISHVDSANMDQITRSTIFSSRYSICSTHGQVGSGPGH